MAYYRKEKYKIYFEIWNENSKLQNKRENSEMSRPTLVLIPVGAKMSDTQKHQQWNIQQVNKKHEKSTYQSTLINTQFFRIIAEKLFFVRR